MNNRILILQKVFCRKYLSVKQAAGDVRQPEERSGNSIPIVDFILCSAHHHIIFDLNQYKQKAENSRLLYCMGINISHK
ncbi:hypothetical protein [Bacillus velezensis]|uniref:hypothetical protein n=1 Tax=Bacillus velezensis TaxID=492670 RepID=UPI0030CDE0D4